MASVHYFIHVLIVGELTQNRQVRIMSSLTSEHLIVVAIDFGTTYSGYAFSLGTEFEKDPAKISSNKPWIASQGLGKTSLL